jgi:Zn-dependent peptidase ImmA (M78 family)
LTAEDSPFNPSRLDLARRRRGVTKRDLGLAVGVPARTLTSWYRLERIPGDSKVKALAEYLQFPQSFFYGSDLDEPPPDSASFRALSRLAARTRDQVLAAGALGIAISDWIAERFRLPEVDIPAYQYADPEEAAIEIRSKWGLGEQPIANMVRLLELHGVRVFSLFEESHDIDAFSFWRDDTPYVFLSTRKTSERSRMDAAHELGHLILHSRLNDRTSRIEEDEAMRFASAFLMPEGSVLARVRRGASMNEIIAAKQYWVVSLAALTYRMRKVGMLTGWEYQTRFKEIGRHNYREQEPESAPRERSEVLSKVFQLLAEDGTHVSQVAGMLSIYPNELNKLLFGFVASPIPLPY